jgi:hypothetical protein
MAEKAGEVNCEGDREGKKVGRDAVGFLRVTVVLCGRSRSVQVGLRTQASAALRALRPCGASFPWAKFTFVIKGTDIETSAAEAAALSTAAALQLFVDVCARSFTVRDDRISADAIPAFDRLLSGGAPLFTPDARPLALLFKQLWHSGLELAFQPLPDISVLSVDALNALLSEGGLAVDSEEALLAALIGLGPEYFPLLCHVRWDFMNPGALGSALSESGVSVPPESVWEGILDLLRRSRAPAVFASRIVADS